VPEILPLKCALIISASDSGGGAGLEADLKTLSAHGVFGCCVVSAVTAQNSLTVTAMECLSPTLVTAQLKAVADDFPIAAIKIGLLGSVANTLAVADFLAAFFSLIPTVIDPVMVSAQGYNFLPPEAMAALRQLLPLATIATPNIPEAGALCGGRTLQTPTEQAAAARELLVQTKAKNILVKGGHGQSQGADDFLAGAIGEIWFPGERVKTLNTHGTGCTLSSAICANLALGLELPQAISLAKDYVTQGLHQSFQPGHGPGPLNHFHTYYRYQ